MDSDVLYLLQEIIRNILVRLPVKSLIRFQCVCKLWKNLVKNPSFIVDHLQHSSRQNPSLLIKYIPFDGNGFDNNNFLPCLRLLDCELQVREVQEAQLIDSLKAVNVVGSCNGLLCLEPKYDNPSFLLWNPATTAVRRVPRSGWFYSIDECVTGFGFSPVVNDYKIVVAYAESDDEPVSMVGVFSLSRGTWKVIDIGNLKGVKLFPETVTANGSIFWYGVILGAEEEDEEDIEVEEYEDDVLVSFDIAKEVFTVIPRLYIGDNEYQELAVYENKLAVLSKPDLFVFDEGMCASGKTWSWTKGNSSPLSYKVRTLGIWGNEIISQPVFKEDDEKGRSVLRLTNVATNEVTRLIFPYDGYIHHIYSYVESLVPVGNN